VSRERVKCTLHSFASLLVPNYYSSI
jgi:hypothetical protein